MVEMLPRLRAPLLGLFGDEDAYPSPAAVAELRDILRANGKQFELHSYPDAGHAFFSPDRISYRPAAANDGWRRIASFFAHHLGATPAQ